MKIKSLALTFLLSFPLLSLANPCQNQYKDSDKTDLPGKASKELSCQFVWQNKDKSSEGLEVLYIKDSCKRFEGGDKSSCLITRHCPKSKEDFPEMGTPIFLTKFYLSNLCESNRKNEYYPILNVSGSQTKKSVQAYVHCKKKVPQSVVLLNGRGDSKICKIPVIK